MEKKRRVIKSQPKVGTSWHFGLVASNVKLSYQELGAWNMYEHFSPNGYICSQSFIYRKN